MLDEYSLSQKWLSQFPLVDQQIGRRLLRSLRLISNSDFERHLDEVLDRLLIDLGDKVVSLFSVPEMISEERLKRNPQKTFRQAGNSSDRIRHYLENFARVRNQRVRTHQTIESMRAERIKHMVLVEDFIGSGDRISSFLQKRMHPSIKSWISYGWIKLWIVAYSGLSGGVWAISRCGYKLTEDSFRFVMPPSYSRANFDEAMLEFCVRNSWRTNRSKIPLGFGNGATNLIFEHGCPNNAPVVLWSPGKRIQPRGERFQPLFPNRGIPTELRPAFGMPTPEVGPEILWKAGQYRLALSLLQEKREGRQSGLWPLPVALGLASRSKWDDKYIAKAIGKPLINVERLREVAVSIGTLEAGSREVTAFGRAFLELIRAGAAEQAKQKFRRQLALEALYYPHSCEGLAQH